LILVWTRAGIAAGSATNVKFSPFAEKICRKDRVEILRGKARGMERGGLRVGSDRRPGSNGASENFG
jgi:hypothetical protein